MKRYALLLTAMTITAAIPRLHALQAQPPAAAPAAGRQEPAPAAPQQGGRGRGRGPQTPPPPPLTCTSPAAPTDNKVPAALAREGFTAIFNGKDLSGWQALIDIGESFSRSAGLRPAPHRRDQ